MDKILISHKKLIRKISGHPHFNFHNDHATIAKLEIIMKEYYPGEYTLNWTKKYHNDRCVELWSDGPIDVFLLMKIMELT